MHDIKQRRSGYVCVTCGVTYKTVAKVLHHVHPETKQEVSNE